MGGVEDAGTQEEESSKKSPSAEGVEEDKEEDGDAGK